MALQGFEFDKWAKEVVFSGKPGFLFFFFFFQPANPKQEPMVGDGCAFRKRGGRGSQR